MCSVYEHPSMTSQAAAGEEAEEAGEEAGAADPEEAGEEAGEEAEAADPEDPEEADPEEPEEEEVQPEEEEEEEEEAGDPEEPEEEEAGDPEEPEEEEAGDPDGLDGESVGEAEGGEELSGSSAQALVAAARGSLQASPGGGQLAVGKLANSSSHKKEYMQFFRMATSKNRFPASLKGEFEKDKLDLFRLWMSSDKDCNKLVLAVERKAG